MPEADTRLAARSSSAARGTHNLKNIDVTLPHGKLDHHHRRQRVGEVVARLRHDLCRRAAPLRRVAVGLRPAVPRADGEAGRRRIEGICPAIAIRQKNSVRNPRSTVGTTTEIHDYMRLLFARVGRTFCRQCGQEVVRETAEVVARRLGELPAGTRLLIGFEIAGRGDAGATPSGAMPKPTRRRRSRRVEADAASRRATAAIRSDCRDARTLRRRGFGRLLVDGRAVAFEEVDRASLERPHDARSRRRSPADRGRLRSRLTDSIETSYREGGGAAFAVDARSPIEPNAHRVLGALRVPPLRHRLRDAAAAAVLVQQPVRRLPDLPRLRQHHRARHGSGRAGSARSRSTRARSSRGASRTIARSSRS